MEMADDILLGADAIAAYLGMRRRQIYHAVEQRYLPTFRIGALVCARKTTLTRWIEAEELGNTTASGRAVINPPSQGGLRQ